MSTSIREYLTGYVAAAVVMLGLDAIWLTLTANSLYRARIGDIMLDGFRPAPAVIFYLLYVGGLVIFAIRPALAAGDWTTALRYGALFGFFAYATYDLTNQATLKSWSTTLTLADMAWGTVLSAISATGGYLAAARLWGSGS